MNFNGKRVLVTGSTSGIGRGAAQLFLEGGARVAINGRNPETVARTIADLGGDLVAAPGDVGTVEGCSQVVETAIERLGGLDCLVSNVGIGPVARMMDVTESHWDEVVAVNLRPALFCTRAALGALRASHGNIVIIASMCGLVAGPPDGFVYSVTKGGLISMTKSLALELAPDNVRVNCICPGYIDTPLIQVENELSNGEFNRIANKFTPLGRIGTVRECASAIVYFASDDARFCTGSILSNDGGCVANSSWGTIEQANLPPSTTAAHG